MDLLRFFVDEEYVIHVIINPWIIILPLIGFVIYLVLERKTLWKTFEIDGTELGIGNQKITLKPSYEDIQIAYKLWVELNTRKIGIPIDFKHDVIIEVYNSWYEFFKITRDLIKSIPISKIKKSGDTSKLVDVAIDVLNVGMRPHLTQWQARFRKWYKTESDKKENDDITPQDLQTRYPEYDSMIQDMKMVNEKLIKYKDILREIAIGRKK